VRALLQRLVLVACAVLAAAPGAQAAGDPADAAGGLRVPERRKPQFTKDFGYAVFPYPYSLPGIGSGLSLVGGMMNIADTYTDVYGIAFSGDVHGASVGVADIHVVPRTLILDVGYGQVSKVTVQSYAERGMDSREDDYRLLELGDMAYFGGRATATFYDRRLEFYGAWYHGASRLQSIRERDGTVIATAQDAPRTSGHTTLLGFRVDLTDDYADPRRGARIDLGRSHSPPRGSGADYYVVDANLTAYVPLGKRSTWAFNLLRSDAHVSRPGVTDPVLLQQELGIDCSLATGEQQRLCNQVIDNLVAENTSGTATTLGGFNRLRGFPQGRYKGAHTLFFGTEFRWNLTEERTPFDIFIWKDVRTAIQLAFFYETGVTSDRREDLADRSKYRDVVGVGFRLVTASGVVFRGDLGYSREGPGAAVFIGYPWEL
jgi:hypothetical protein